MSQRSSKPLIAAIWLSVTVLFAFLLALLWNAHRTIENNLSNRALSLVRLVSEHADAEFMQADLVLQSVLDRLVASDFTHAKQLPAARRHEIEALLLQLKRRTQSVVSMSVTDADGYVFANSVGVPPGVSLGDRPYFLELKAGPASEPVVSDAIKGRVSNKWGIQVARRFRFADGSFAGMVVVNLGLEETFGSFYTKLGTEPDMLVTLRSETKKILVRYPKVEEVMGKVVTGSSSTDSEVTSGEEVQTSSVSPIDRVERVVALRRLTSVPVIAVVGLGKQGALVTWNIEAGVSVLLLLGMLIAAASSTLTLLRRDVAAAELAQAHGDLLLANKQLDEHRLALSKALALAEANASHDELTGLWNRRSCQQRLDEAIARAQRNHQPLCLLLLDLDHFKDINDTFGHQRGDTVLREFADILRQRLRETDFPTRWGGEEFVVILENTSGEQAEKLAADLVAAVGNHPFTGISRQTVSIGLTEFMPETNAESLLHRADAALYAAKSKGRDQYSVFAGEDEA